MKFLGIELEWRTLTGAGPEGTGERRERNLPDLAWTSPAVSIGAALPKASRPAKIAVAVLSVNCMVASLVPVSQMC